MVIALAVIGILYGALVAIGQTDIKRLIAYTSISHFGFITLGIFAMTTTASSGSMLYMFNHGFSTAALFLVAGFMISRRGSRLIADYGGVQRVAPMLAGTFLVAGLSSLALPGLSSFISEFLVLVGTFPRYQVAAVLATLGIILASVYILLMYQRTMTGEPNESTSQWRDLGRREVAVVAPLLAVIIALGFYPKPLLDVINPSIERTMEQVGSTRCATRRTGCRRAGAVSAVSTAPVQLAAAFDTPSIDYGLLAPMLIVFGVAVVGVLVEAFMPRLWRHEVQFGLAAAGLIGAFVALVLSAGDVAIIAQGAIAVDGPAQFLQGVILLLALTGLLATAEQSLDTGGPFTSAGSSLPGSEHERTLTATGVTQTEIFPLLMFAVGGMLMFPAANDLLTMFVALEVLSLPLYLLCGLARRRRLLSQEASLKYFLLGAFSSAFFLYGVALLYGYAGTVRLSGIADAVSKNAGSDGLLLVGTALVSVGLLFKIGAAPFHAWTPDVYQGAPTPITGFMAACTKVAAFGALLRVFYVGLGGLAWDWEPMIWAVAILTMVIGSVVALTQTDVKRMLAYSSIAHAGFILTGLVATDTINAETGEVLGVSSVLFYLVAYGFSTIGAFAVVTLVRDSAGEATHLSQWAGLGRRSPLVAGVFALFLLAFAGIPLTSGFTAKFAVFSAAVEGGATPLVIVGVVMSAVAAFFYVRVIVLMFFSEPSPDGPSVVVPSVLTTMTIAIAVAVTVVLGVLPTQVLDLAAQASQFVR